MHIARRLSEAIGSWLHMEFCCYRAGLFSESSLKAAVGHVLSAFPISAKGTRVHADFAHEFLNPIRRIGRKRAVDFALVLAGSGLPKRNAEIVVETKWAGSSHCTGPKIFQDFLRLAAIKRGDPKTTCLFILAGSHKDVSLCLADMPFTGAGKINKGIGASGSEKKLSPDSSNISHRECFSEIIRNLSVDGFGIPKSLVCKSYGLHPRQTDGRTVGFQSIAWEVTSVAANNLNPEVW